MSIDPLSDILRMTEAKSILSGRCAAGGAWSLRFPPPGQIVFAAIVSGRCLLRRDGQKKAVQLHAGDVGMLPGREGFVICSSLRVPPLDVVLTDHWSDLETLGDGLGCTWLAGRVALQAASAFLLTEALPDMVLVRASGPGAGSLRSLLEEILDERASSRLGASLVASQLAQLFFVKCLRAYVAGSGTLPSGWLRAVGDERILHALRSMHAEPGRDISLDELAKTAGMSRTRFAVLFKAIAGVAPLAYLTRWRMQLAQRALRDDGASIVELATSLGYGSESAFSNAFKRVTGSAPSAYRAAARVERARMSADLSRIPDEAV